MSRLWILSLLVVGITTLGVTSSSIVAQTTGTSKRPLDLPAGKFGKDEEDQEDESETIIFYGQEYEAQAFFWCLDRSGSMQGNRLSILKQEVTAAINSLTGQAEMGFVSFSDGHTAWAELPVKATVAQKGSAIAWVQQLQASGLTCMAPAAVKAVQISNMSRKRDKSIILISDGSPNCPACPETITAITGANWQQTAVNTLFIGAEATGAGCMQQIASANFGSFTQVQ